MAFVSAPVSLTRSSATSHVTSRRSTFTTRAAPRRATVPHRRVAAAAPRMQLGQTVKESLISAKIYKTLIQLADAAGVDLDVSNCTVFAPSDATFARTRPGFVANLLACPADAAAVLARHILPGRVLTSKQIQGSGFWDGVLGGPLPYEGIGPIVRVGNARILSESCDNECDNGIIHTIDSVIATPMYKPQGVAQTYVPSVKAFSDSTVESVYPVGPSSTVSARASGACLPSTTGGRKAMGLIKQLPFWQYGPPFNAAKQEDYEPISIAQPEGSSVDYQLMPPGTVVVTPDETSAEKLLPVSGMSKYIGKTKRLVEGDGLSDYSRLPY